MTQHAHNWKSSAMITADGMVRTACGLRRSPEDLAPTPTEITCDICALKVFREGQERKLDIMRTMEWTWADVGAPPPPRTETVIDDFRLDGVSMTPRGVELDGVIIRSHRRVVP